MRGMPRGKMSLVLRGGKAPHVLKVKGFITPLA